MAALPKPILVVDDDQDIRETLAELLQEEGYCVLQAGNGAEALTMLRGEARPGLILLDLMMPVMDGWQFRSTQLADTEISDIPVVVISATGQEQKLARLDVVDFLKKPIHLEQLLTAVQRHCQPAR